MLVLLLSSTSISADNENPKSWVRSIEHDFEAVAVDIGGSTYLSDRHGILKLNPDGKQIWRKEIFLEAEHWINGIYPRPNGDIFVTGVLNRNNYPDGCSIDSRIVPDDGTYFYFIVRLDEKGEFCWARTWVSSECCDEPGIIHLRMDFDSSSNVYLAGIYENYLDIDPGPNEQMFTVGYRLSNSFACKLDHSGALLWSKEWNSRCKSICVGSDSSILLSGIFYNSTDFNPGVEEAFVTPVNDNLDNYILKLDSDGNFASVNTWEWVKSDSRFHIFWDRNMNIYQYGPYYGQTKDDEISIIDDMAKGKYLYAVRKVDHCGNLRNTIVFETKKSTDINVFISEDGAIFIIDYFLEKLDLNAESDHVAKHNEKQYITRIRKLNTDGQLNWIHTWNSDKMLFLYIVGVDSAESIYLKGRCSGSIDMDLAQEGYEIVNPEVFIMKLRPDGTFDCLD